MTESTMRSFISGLDLPVADKARLMAMTQASYIGLAESLAKDELKFK